MKLRECSHELIYDWRYDCYFCHTCDEWRSGNCVDPECEYCTDRPLTPSLAGDVPPEPQE